MKKYWIYILSLSILALGCLLHFMRGSYGFSSSTSLHAWGRDDAFITYRYGWNLAHFNILNWNESGYQRADT